MIDFFMKGFFEMKRILSLLLCFVLVSFATGCSVPYEPSNEPVESGSVDMPEKFVGTWTCDTDKNLDPDTNEPIVTLTIDPDGKLTYLGKEYYVEKTEEFHGGEKTCIEYTYNRGRVKIDTHGPEWADNGEPYVVVMIKGHGYGRFLKGELEVTLPQEVLGTWVYLLPEDSDKGTILHDKDGNNIVDFTISESGININGTEYPIDLVRTMANIRNGNNRYCFGKFESDLGNNEVMISEGGYYEDSLNHGWKDGHYQIALRIGGEGQYSTEYLNNVTPVEITKDNWEDYFEVKPVFDYDRFIKFSSGLVIREKEGTNIVAAKDLKVDADILSMKFMKVAFDTDNLAGGNKITEMTDADYKELAPFLIQDFPHHFEEQIESTTDRGEKMQTYLYYAETADNKLVLVLPGVAGASVEYNDFSGTIYINEDFCADWNQ